jgi:D-arabinose 1-dehydrogenase-like Zn-dependent alcohol dehydrogenase
LIGITVWAPFMHNKIGPEHKVGIIGVGGLGHLAIQFGVKLGCHTTGISTSPDKEREIKVNYFYSFITFVAFAYFMRYHTRYCSRQQ